MKQFPNGVTSVYNRSGIARRPEKLEDLLGRGGCRAHECYNIACRCLRHETKGGSSRVSYAVNYPLLISQRWLVHLVLRGRPGGKRGRDGHDDNRKLDYNLREISHARHLDCEMAEDRERERESGRKEGRMEARMERAPRSSRALSTIPSPPTPPRQLFSNWMRGSRESLFKLSFLVSHHDLFATGYRKKKKKTTRPTMAPFPSTIANFASSNFA